MKFILWTLVWFGVNTAIEALELYWHGGFKGYNADYSPLVQVISGTINFTLWIGLYYKVIKKEK